MAKRLSMLTLVGLIFSNRYFADFNFVSADTTLNAQVRAQIPISVQRRPEIYAKALLNIK